MRQKIKRSIKEGDKFRREFKREIRLLIIITLGFTIAFTWRQTIFDASQIFVRFVTHSDGPVVLSILTSLFITIICVLLVYLISHILKDTSERY